MRKTIAIIVSVLAVIAFGVFIFYLSGAEERMVLEEERLKEEERRALVDPFPDYVKDLSDEEGGVGCDNMVPKKFTGKATTFYDDPGFSFEFMHNMECVGFGVPNSSQVARLYNSDEPFEEEIKVFAVVDIGQGPTTFNEIVEDARKNWSSNYLRSIGIDKEDRPEMLVALEENSSFEVTKFNGVDALIWRINFLERENHVNVRLVLDPEIGSKKVMISGNNLDLEEDIDLESFRVVE